MKHVVRENGHRQLKRYRERIKRDKNLRSLIMRIEKNLKALHEPTSQKVLPKSFTAEKGPRPPRKPLVHCYNRAIILLDLLFSQSKIGNEGYVKVTFNHKSSSLSFDIRGLQSLFCHSYQWVAPRFSMGVFIVLLICLSSFLILILKSFTLMRSRRFQASK